MTPQPDLRPFLELCRSGMEPSSIFETIKARPPATDKAVCRIDLEDLYVCVKCMFRATDDMKTEVDASALFCGIVAFGLYVGLLCERLSETPRIKELMKTEKSK